MWQRLFSAILSVWISVLASFFCTKNLRWWGVTATLTCGYKDRNTECSWELYWSVKVAGVGPPVGSMASPATNRCLGLQHRAWVTWCQAELKSNENATSHYQDVSATTAHAPLWKSRHCDGCSEPSHPGRTVDCFSPRQFAQHLQIQRKLSLPEEISRETPPWFCQTLYLKCRNNTYI